MRSAVVAFACALAVASPSRGGATPAVSYAYDASAPLDFGIETTVEGGGVRVSDVSFRAGATILHAALVAPVDARGAAPGVLFAHWLGTAATTNRSEFLEDARWLARRGVVSLVPDQPWARPGWFEHVRSTDTDAADSIAEVVALRRSLDALLAQPGVDPHRIAFVGHDFGATYGALLAGVDARPHAFVFMAPALALAEWFLLDTARPPADRSAYEATMAAFDVPAALGRLMSPTLLQFARHDEYVSRANAERFAHAVGAADRTVITYRTDHALALDRAVDDRRAWLAAHLELR